MVLGSSTSVRSKSGQKERLGWDVIIREPSAHPRGAGNFLGCPQKQGISICISLNFFFNLLCVYLTNICL